MRVCATTPAGLTPTSISRTGWSASWATLTAKTLRRWSAARCCSARDWMTLSARRRPSAPYNNLHCAKKLYLFRGRHEEIPEFDDMLLDFSPARRLCYDHH